MRRQLLTTTSRIPGAPLCVLPWVLATVGPTPCATAQEGRLGSLFAAPFLAAEAPGRPVAVGCADFNSDGVQDLVVTNPDLGTVSISLGQGDGTFGSSQDYEVDGAPIAVVCLELNGDGREDLATANGGWAARTANTVSVLFGRGDGTFEPRLDLVTGKRPYSITSGDLDGDTDTDLVVPNYDSHSLSVLVNDGEGSFVRHDLHDTAVTPVSVAIGDLNLDGVPDLVSANSRANTVSVLLGRGAGSFVYSADYWTGTSPGSVVIFDFTDDGHPDVLVANGGETNTLSLLTGDGNGRLTGERTLAAAGGAASLVLADLDGNEELDLVMLQSSQDRVSIQQLHGDGGLSLLSEFRTLNRGTGLACADLNGDGRRDFVVVNGGDIVAVHRNRGHGRFGVGPDLGAGAAPNAVVMGDVDGDGRRDLAVGAEYRAVILLGHGDGTFDPRRESGQIGRDLALGDLNADGHLDLVTTLSVSLGVGDGTFVRGTDHSNWDNRSGVALADLDRDGKLDVIAADPHGAVLSVQLGLGNGEFGPRTDHRGASGCHRIIVCDLDENGDPDLAVANLFTSSVSVWLGRGDGHLRGGFPYETPGAAPGIAVADLDGDGHQDLAACVSSGVVSVFPGRGDGEFNARRDYATSPYPRFVAAGDLDGDGDQDLVTAHWLAPLVTVLLNDGDGSFPRRVGFGAGQSPIAIAIGDLNADGRPELAVANEGSGTVTILVNGDPVLPPTPITVTDFTAMSSEAGVRLTWSLSGSAIDELRGVHPYRSHGAAGPYLRCAPALLPPRTRMSYVDPVTGGTSTLWYRLGLVDLAGSETLGPAVPVNQSLGTAYLTALRRPIRRVGGDIEIGYTLGPASAVVDLAIFDIRGRRLQTLDAGHRQSGSHVLLWDRRDRNGMPVPRGVYVARLRGGNVVDARKVPLPDR